MFEEDDSDYSFEREPKYNYPPSPMSAKHMPPGHYLHELPSEDEERIGTLFKRLDVNNDGRIDISDLTKGLKEMGVPYSSSSAKELLQQGDVTKSGDLSLAEFIHYMVGHEKRLRLIFSHLDRNQDGKIDLDELMVAFHQLGVKLNQQEAQKLVERMDKEGTLEITFEEWRDYLLFHPSGDIHSILSYWRHSTFLDIGEDMNIPDDFTPQELMTGLWWRHLVAGAIAGAVSRTCTAPLDRLKVFLQVHGTSPFGGFLGCLRHMLQEGGVQSLWRGNGINVLKIAPETAFKFMAYEYAKRFIKGKSHREITIEERFVAGSFAGTFSQTVIYPLEVLKTRLALRRTGQYKGISDAAKKIFRQEGMRSFYRGYLPNLLGIIPYAGIDLTVYETLKNAYLSGHTDNPSIFVALVCGTTSSTCGQLASYPLALVRTRLQAQAVLDVGTAHAVTMMSLFRTIIQTEGMTGLYRGITPNLMKVVPAVSISYMVYEKCRNALGVQMT